MRFSINVYPRGTHNADFKASGRAFKKAAFMQTERQHKDAIDKYTKERERQFVRIGMTPRQIANAKARAKAWAENYDEPQKVEEYWKRDQEPRRPISLSSSWVGGVHIVPSLGLARLNLNGRNYSYSLTPEFVGKMLTSGSIGGYYNSNLKGDTAHFTKSKALGWDTADEE
jgi:hypothetical protein